MDTESNIEKYIERRDSEWKKINRQIFENPELQYEEYKAHAFLTAWLEENGWHVRRKAFGIDTAFEASYAKGNGRAVSFNAEYDALPGMGHACGHNLICTASVAAAAAVKDALESAKASGKVVLYGTPAEEGGGGKQRMIEGGAFKDVDVSMMVHPTRDNLVAGGSTLAHYRLVVEYHGKSSHAAGSPHEGKNALDAFVLAYNSISALRQQILPTDRIHGIIIDGGKAPNIIPDYTRSEWSFRSTSRERLEELKKQVVSCFEAAATASGTKLEITWTCDYYNLVSNQVLNKVFAKAADSRLDMHIPVPEDVTKIEFPGSTDQGNVSWVVPSIHPWYKIGGSINNHNAGFTAQAGTDLAYQETIKQAKLLAITATAYLTDGKLAAEVREEFDANKF